MCVSWPIQSEIQPRNWLIFLLIKLPDVAEQDLAAKLKKQKLFEMFPGIDRVALEEVFQANGYDFLRLLNNFQQQSARSDE